MDGCVHNHVGGIRLEKWKRARHKIPVLLAAVLSVGLGGCLFRGYFLPPPEKESATVTSACGSDTAGGAGGRVIAVENLKGEGPGSLRDALDASGPRTVIFSVSGVIDLAHRPLVVSSGHLTIDGSSAPAGGITLVRGPLVIAAPEVIVRHLRIRPGDGGDLKTPGYDSDALSVVGPGGRRVLIENCSFSWAIDENIGLSGIASAESAVREVTVRNCIVAEGLSHSTHAKGEHSKGMLIYDYSREIAVVGNLFVSNTERNPYCKPNTLVFVGNNIIYNYGRNAVHLSCVPEEYWLSGRDMRPAEVTAVDNLILAGNDSETVFPFNGWGYLYRRDNRAWSRDGREVAELYAAQLAQLDKPPLWLSNYAPVPPENMLRDLLPRVGARPGERDAADRRIVDGLLRKNSKIIDAPPDEFIPPPPGTDTERP